MNIINQAINNLKKHEPSEGYYLLFSGGKDSVIIKRLAEMAGIKYESHYSLTTIDPPELVKFIKKYHKDVIFDIPKRTFFRMIEERGYPSRKFPKCCEEFKEKYGNNRTVISGIRKEESSKRSKRKLYDKTKNKIYLNLIIDWTEADVWQFIENEKLPYCELYNRGWHRIGCLGCIKAGKKQRLWELNQYPRIIKAYIKAFEKRFEKEKQKEFMRQFKTGEEFFWWYIQQP